MVQRKARLSVEVMEDRWTPSCATLGEGVSQYAQSAPHAQADLVHTVQAAEGTTGFGGVVVYTVNNPNTFPGC
jgi:hypothetical protein